MSQTTLYEFTLFVQVPAWGCFVKDSCEIVNFNELMLLFQSDRV
ncbi:hypothetical protein GYH30_015997 [Glycine max]|nr:hypothetical protein GYH30_015997 [Glycine max]